MSRLILLATALVALGGCAEYGMARDVYDRFPGRTARRADGGYGRADDYSRTREYRRISADAADYARRVDASLRTGQEGRIRDLLADRTARLLERTPARDHSRVYPFPRRFSGDSRDARDFWAGADRDIERLLGRRDADVYRRYVQDGGRYDQGRYDDDQGRYDDGRDDRRDDDRNARGRDARGRDDGERSGSDRGQNGRRDDRRTDRRDGQAGRPTRQPDRAGPRPGETLEEYYRRQAREQP